MEQRLTPAKLLERAAEYRYWAAMARAVGTREALIRLANRYEKLAKEICGSGSADGRNEACSASDVLRRSSR